MQSDVFNRAAAAAACDTLNQLGGSLVNLGVWTMWKPAVGVTAMTLGAASNLAYQFGCGEFDAGVAADTDFARGCQQLSSGEGDLRVYEADGTYKTTIKSDITGYKVGLPYTEPSLGVPVRNYTFQTVIGGPYGDELTYGTSEGNYVEMYLQSGAVCGEDVPPEPPLPPDIDPYDYTDIETGCELTINFLGFAQLSEGGQPQLIYKMESPTTTNRNLRNPSGGRIGGCIIEPIVYSGGGGCCPPPTNFPYPDPEPPNGPDGEPWWADYLKGALGGVASGLLTNLLQGLIDGLFTTDQPGITYKMLAACNYGPNGEIDEWEYPIPPLPILDAIGARVTALNAQIEQHLLWKTPTCGPDRPELLGDWVTVRFESLEISPQGTRPLRKLFRYRSQSALDLGQKAAYWESFTWNAGSVCVQHKGAWWGTPQCWAENADEGKRVIRFAGLEAGIDPDQSGEWVISGSSDPRFGMPGTMQVAKVQGLEWVTSRQGPSGLPLLTVDP